MRYVVFQKINILLIIILITTISYGATVSASNDYDIPASEEEITYEENGVIYHSAKIYNPIHYVIKFDQNANYIFPTTKDGLKSLYDEKFTLSHNALSGTQIFSEGWHKLDGYNFYFNEDGELIQDVRYMFEDTTNYLVAVNKKENCVTIFTLDYEGFYTIPLVSFIVSCGDRTPVGLFSSREHMDWKLMYHDIYTKYSTRIVNHFLFHSCLYNEMDNFAFRPESYNTLGTKQSGGCIRMQGKDCYWIYNNIHTGTPVLVYESDVPGPFDMPRIERILEPYETYDPTDPDVTLASISQLIHPLATTNPESLGK
ncbi:MAG: L,D-transpeptidase [Eubacteriales bacterium]|nr:L,D-transpeptidase [Eubacteriales bacterium]